MYNTRERKSFKRQIAGITLFTLLAWNFSPFLTVSAAGKEVEEINFYKYDVDQKFDSEKNQIVVKNFSDTQQDWEKKEFFDIAEEEKFATGSTIDVNLVSDLNVLVHWMTLWNNDNSDYINLYWVKDLAELISMIDSVSIWKNITDYHKIFNNKDFLSAKLVFKNTAKMELVDIIAMDILDTSFKNIIEGKIWETVWYVDISTETSLVQGLAGFMAKNMHFIDTKYDYSNEKNNIIVLWEVFKKEIRKIWDEENPETKEVYVWTKSFSEEDFVLEEWEIVVKSYEEIKDNPDFDLTGFEEKDFGNTKRILVDINNINPESSIYGYKLNNNNLVIKWIENNDELVEAINSITLTKDEQKDSFSAKVNFGESAIDFVDLATSTELWETLSILTEITEEENIKSFVSLFGETKYIPEWIYSWTENINLWVIYNVETYKLEKEDITKKEEPETGFYDFSKIIAKDEIREITVSEYDPINHNKYPLEWDRLSKQAIKIPAFNEIEGQLWLANMTILEWELANDVLLLPEAITNEEFLNQMIISAKITESKEASGYYYDLELYLAPFNQTKTFSLGEEVDFEYEWSILMTNAIKTDSINLEELDTDADSFVDIEQKVGFVNSLFNRVFISDDVWKNEQELEATHSITTSMTTWTSKIEIINWRTNTGTLSIYKDKDFNNELSVFTINPWSWSLEDIEIKNLDPLTEYFYKIDLSNTFNIYGSGWTFTTTDINSEDISADKAKAIKNSFTEKVIDSDDIFKIVVSKFDEEKNNKNDLKGFRKSAQRLEMPDFANIRWKLVIENFTTSLTSPFSYDVLILPSEMSKEELDAKLTEIKVSDGQGTYKTFTIKLDNGWIIEMTNVINGKQIKEDSLDEDNKYTPEAKTRLIENLYERTIMTPSYFATYENLSLETNTVENITNTKWTIKIKVAGELARWEYKVFSDTEELIKEWEFVEKELNIEVDNLEAGKAYNYKVTLENKLNQNKFENNSFTTLACPIGEHKDEWACISNIQTEIIDHGERTREWDTEGEKWGIWKVKCNTNYKPKWDLCVYDDVQYPTEDLSALKWENNTFTLKSGIEENYTLGIRLDNLDNENKKNEIEDNKYRISDQKVVLPNLSEIKWTLVIENMTPSFEYFANDALIFNEENENAETLNEKVSKAIITAWEWDYYNLELYLKNNWVLRFTNLLENKDIKDYQLTNKELKEEDQKDLIKKLFISSFSNISKWNLEKELKLTVTHIVWTQHASVEVIVEWFAGTWSLVLYKNWEAKSSIEVVNTKTVAIDNLDYQTDYSYMVYVGNTFNVIEHKDEFTTKLYPTNDYSEKKWEEFVVDHSDFDLNNLEIHLIKLADFDLETGKKVNLKWYKESDIVIAMPSFDEINGRLIVENMTIRNWEFADDVFIINNKIDTKEKLFNHFWEVFVIDAKPGYKTIILSTGVTWKIELENVMTNQDFGDLSEHIEEGKLTEEGKNKFIDLVWEKSFVTKDFFNKYRSLSITSTNTSNITNNSASINAEIKWNYTKWFVVLYNDEVMETEVSKKEFDNSFTETEFTELDADQNYYFEVIAQNVFLQRTLSWTFKTEACAFDEHIESWVCKNNIETREIENWSQEKTWNNEIGEWGEWITSCNTDYRPVGDICVFNGAEDKEDDLSSYKWNARTHDYKNTIITQHSTHTVKVSEFNEAKNNKNDLEGFRKSDQRLLMPDFANIKGKLVIENFTTAITSAFANDVLVLASKMTAEELDAKFTEINVKDWQWDYKTFTIKLDNGWVIEMTNVINKKHIVAGSLDENNNLIPVAKKEIIKSLLGKTIMSLEEFETYKSLAIKTHNISDITETSAKLNLEIVWELTNWNYKLYSDILGKNMIEEGKVTNNFSKKFENLEKWKAYYYVLTAENVLNQEIENGNFVTSLCPTGEHFEWDKCISNKQKIEIENGYKERVWEEQAWSNWTVTCNINYKPMWESCVYSPSSAKSSGWYSASDRSDFLIKNNEIKEEENKKDEDKKDEIKEEELKEEEIKEEDKTVSFVFTTYSRYSPNYISKLNANSVKDINKRTNLENIENLDAIISLAENDYKVFVWLTDDKEFAYYRDKMLYAYEQILESSRILASSETDTRLLSNAKSQNIQALKVYEQALQDRNDLIERKYQWVETVKIGKVTAQKLKVFSNNDEIGKELERKIDSMYESRLTADNLEAVMNMRNSALINIKQALDSEKEIDMDEMLAMIDFEDLLPNKHLEQDPAIREEEDDIYPIETITPINPIKKKLVIALINELFTEETAKTKLLEELETYSQSWADELMAELIKIKVEVNK